MILIWVENKLISPLIAAEAQHFSSAEKYQKAALRLLLWKLVLGLWLPHQPMRKKGERRFGDLA